MLVLPADTRVRFVITSDDVKASLRRKDTSLRFILTSAISPAICTRTASVPT